MSNVRITLSLVIVAALLGACSSTPVNAPASAPTAMPTSAEPPQATAQLAAAPVAARVPEYLDPKSAVSSQRSVYFEFDEFSINKEYAPLIERHGRYLASNPGLAIRVEGSADERGSKEYNLALGQRRAEAVVRALKLFGVKDSQMEATSGGEEKPVATGHDEAAWSQNRRADLQYPNK